MNEVYLPPFFYNIIQQCVKIVVEIVMEKKQFFSILFSFFAHIFDHGYQQTAKWSNNYYMSGLRPYR